MKEYDSETDPEREKACYDAEATVPSPKTPWTSLENPGDGMYADFAAWERWVGDYYETTTCTGINGPCKYGDIQCDSCKRYEWWTDLDVASRAMLYGCMYRIVDFKEAERLAKHAQKPGGGE